MFYKHLAANQPVITGQNVNKVSIFVRTLLLALMFTFLSACQSYKIADSWPTEIPARQLFVKSYLERRDLAEATDRQLESHLGWIKKFYLGTSLYPQGWLFASNEYVDNIESSNKKESVLSRLEKLGFNISNEWAQDNDVRLINSANIATWASAMRTASERGEHVKFLSHVEKDVQDLINGKLDKRAIKYERYFAEEVYDDF